jgi:hypothetical protein
MDKGWMDCCEQATAEANKRIAELEAENEVWLETVAAHRAMLIEAEAKLEAVEAEDEH